MKMHKIEDIGATTIYSNNSVSLTENEQSTVKLSLITHCYTWTINDFSNCLKFRSCQFSSPSFIFQNTEWRLRLCVITENGKVKNMKIHLTNKNKIASDLYFKNNISIVDDDGQVLSQADVEFSSSEGDAAPSSPVYLVAPWGSESFALPAKLTVRSEFSSLISEMSVDTELSLGKSDEQNVSDFHCGTMRDTTVSPSPKRCTRRPVSIHTRSTFSRVNECERSLADLEELQAITCLRAFILVLFCISVVPIAFFLGQAFPKPINNQDVDTIPTITNKEINYLIFDSTKKINLIAEALNLTSVKEKSLEILSMYSKMYNSTAHVQSVMQGIESNLTQGLAS